MLACRNHLGLLSEDIDPDDARAVGQLSADLFAGRPDQLRDEAQQNLGGRRLRRRNWRVVSRLVVVSNRVTPITGSKAATAGGLAVGVLAALRETGGIWFGWSGETIESGTPIPKVVRTGNITYITIDLPQAEFERYYGGFANRTLWPLFHYRLDLSSFDRDWYVSYRRVNQLFAEQLYPYLRDDDLIWVHDYHLIPLGEELRQLGIRLAHRLLPAHPVPVGRGLRRAALARPPDGGAAPVRSGRLPDQQRSAQLPRLSVSRGDRLRARRRPGARLRPHAARAGFPDRHRHRGFRRDGDLGRGGAREPAAVAQPARPQADHRRRPARLHQGHHRAPARLRDAAAELSAPARPGDLRADLGALARGGAGISRDAPPGRGGLGPDQRALQRVRLDAAALPQPRLHAAHARRLLPHVADRPGDAAARRHEPGRQGIRRGAVRRRIRACWCCRASPAPRTSSTAR